MVSLWGVTWQGESGVSVILMWGTLGAHNLLDPTSVGWRVRGFEWPMPAWLWHIDVSISQDGFLLSVPLWIPAAAAVLVIAAVWGERWRRRIRFAKGLCPACCYDCSGIMGRCPECGHSLSGSPRSP